MNTIDYVFPVVDCNDPIWQKTYRDTRRSLDLSTEINPVRFRTWDNLRYLFRAIDKNLPFIRKIHMIVSNREQIPDWLDTEKVHVVCHKEFIPEEFLPTFNSCTIEMFLGNIPGLAERYIYGNDDCFPLKEMTEEDFYEDGKVKILIKKEYGQNTQFKKVEYNTQCKAAKACGKDPGGWEDGFLKVQHSINPMLKSSFNRLHKIIGDDIYNSCTKFREEKNLNQYLYSLCEYYSDNLTSPTIGYSYFSINDKNLEDICNCIVNQENYNICINDVKALTDESFNRAKKEINEAFASIFPDKCKYEKYANVVDLNNFTVRKENGILTIEVPYANDFEESYLTNGIRKLLGDLKY